MFVWKSTFKKLLDQYKALEAENAGLKANLKKAMKNDHRDAKGRFKKA